MKDILIIGGRNSAGNDKAYSLDSLSNFTGGAEPGQTLLALTRPFFPLGPSGDVIFRRLYVTVSHTRGISFSVTPIVDDVELKTLKTYLSRPSTKERYTFMVPLGLVYKKGATGVRASSIQFKLEADSVVGDWKIESIEVVFAGGLTSKREDD